MATKKVGKLIKHGCGATSSKLNGRFDLVPFAGIELAAERAEYGLRRHGKNNWRKGDRAFAEERISHMVRHATKFAESPNREDLAAVLFNAAMVADYMKRGILPEQEPDKKKE